MTYNFDSSTLKEFSSFFTSHAKNATCNIDLIFIKITSACDGSSLESLSNGPFPLDSFNLKESQKKLFMKIIASS